MWLSRTIKMHCSIEKNRILKNISSFYFYSFNATSFLFFIFLMQHLSGENKKWIMAVWCDSLVWWQANCIGTIKNVANVCCVQFSSHSSHLLAFGSADYKTYCYDLRNTRIPWCTLAGHGKAVSYVKFLDSCTLVSASTDNTLKIWDLNKTTYSGLSTNASSLTLSGHMNEKVCSLLDGLFYCRQL